MTTSLHDRLADLAEGAPPGGPDPGLWQRGRRRHVGIVVIVAVTLVALASLGATGWYRSQGEPLPASPAPGMHLPDHIYAPSSRLAGTDEAGPIGPVSALIYASRHMGLRDSVHGMVGISASTGEYRFLDLPGWPTRSVRISQSQFQTPGVVPSHDGRRVAYMFVDPAVDRQASRSDALPWDGVRVVDLVTGGVQTYIVDPSEDVASDPVWVGDEVWIALRAAGVGYQTVVAWTPGRDPRSSWRWQERDGDPVPAVQGGYGGYRSLIAWRGRHEIQTWQSGRVEPTDWHVDPPLEQLRGIAEPRSADRLATVVDPDGENDSTAAPSRIAVLTPGARPAQSTSALVPDAEAVVLLGWRDDRHVVTGAWYYLDDVRTVDVDTGESSPLMSVDDELMVTVALDAWAAPTFHAPRPPDPPDPLVLAGLGAGIVLVGGIALRRWTRRVRA